MRHSGTQFTAEASLTPSTLAPSFDSPQYAFAMSDDYLGIGKLAEAIERGTREFREVAKVYLEPIAKERGELQADKIRFVDKTTGSRVISIAPFENFSDNPPSRNGTKLLNPSTALTRHASHALPLTPHLH